MSTDAPFDPCRQWLGLDAAELGDSRKVLGVPARERDPQAVLRAAEARLSLLRAVSAGPYEPARAGLIRLVEEAREKLLAELGTAVPPPARVASGGLAMPPPPSTLPPKPAPVPPAIPPVLPLTPPAAVTPIIAVPRPQAPPPVPGAAAGSASDPLPGGGLEQIKIRTTVYRKQTPVAEIALTMLALIAAGAGLLYYRATTVAKKEVTLQDKPRRPQSIDVPPEREPRKPSTPKPRQPVDPVSNGPVAPERPRPPRGNADGDRGMRPEPVAVPQRDDPPPRPAPMSVEEPPAKPMPMKQPPEKDAAATEKMPPKSEAGAMAKDGPPPKPDDPRPDPAAEEFYALDKPLTEVLKEMRLQNFDTVERSLAAAERKAESAEARSRINDWQHLATYLKGFYDYRERALASVKSGDEYEVNGNKIAIVESDANRLVFRTTGERKEYARDKIPSGIVLAVLVKWFDSNPANDLYLGSYHLAKKESDPRRAREHWQRAQAGGADASALMPLLDDSVFTKADDAEEK